MPSYQQSVASRQVTDGEAARKPIYACECNSERVHVTYIVQVANQDESAASQGVEPPTLQQALPQVHPQLQPFLGQMLAAAQMQTYGNEQQQQQPQLPPGQQLQGISNMTPVPHAQDSASDDQHQQEEQ